MFVRFTVHRWFDGIGTFVFVFLCQKSKTGEVSSKAIVKYSAQEILPYYKLQQVTTSNFLHVVCNVWEEKGCNLFERVEDKIVMQGFFTFILMDDTKIMPYSFVYSCNSEVLWWRFGNWVNQVPVSLIIWVIKLVELTLNFINSFS